MKSPWSLRPSGTVSPTIASPTFTGTVTFGDGSAATATAASNLSGASDPAIVFGNNSIDFQPSSGNTRYRIDGATASFGLGLTQLVAWGSTSAPTGTNDVGISRAGANSLIFGAGTTSTVTSRTVGNKTVTGIANAAATDVLTVTIPNAAHHAVLEIEVQGVLGAGGAIGAGSAMATNTYKIAIVRTAGVATVATATAATHAVAVAVAGSETVTATAAVTAMTGLVSATQTFTVQMTITRSAGSSTNHTALINYKLMNGNATGITIA